MGNCIASNTKVVDGEVIKTQIPPCEVKTAQCNRDLDKDNIFQQGQNALDNHRASKTQSVLRSSKVSHKLVDEKENSKISKVNKPEQEIRQTSNKNISQINQGEKGNTSAISVSKKSILVNPSKQESKVEPENEHIEYLKNNEINENSVSIIYQTSTRNYQAQSARPSQKSKIASKISPNSQSGIQESGLSSNSVIIHEPTNRIASNIDEQQPSVQNYDQEYQPFSQIKSHSQINKRI